MSDKFDISLYDEDFFLWHKTHVRDQAVSCMSWYIGRFPEAKSFCDFGCGIGSYLEAPNYLRVNGLDFHVKGFEISEVAKQFTPTDLQPFIEYRDCTKPIITDRFDCVLSFETAEHIEPEGTEQFILNLVEATGQRLLFTAAPPGQDGTGHINCRFKSFWIGEIGEFLDFNPELTKEISTAWEKLGAPWYIVNNLIVFER